MPRMVKWFFRGHLHSTDVNTASGLHQLGLKTLAFRLLRKPTNFCRVKTGRVGLLRIVPLKQSITRSLRRSLHSQVIETWGALYAGHFVTHRGFGHNFFDSGLPSFPCLAGTPTRDIFTGGARTIVSLRK